MQAGTAYNSARWIALSLKVGGAALLFAGAILDWRARRFP